MSLGTAPAGPVGVLGGTFDPIHLGHLLIAEQARDALGLSRVLFVPAARPPHKDGAGLTHPERRASMVGLAIADHPSFALSRIELDRDGPSWTVATLEDLATGGGTGGKGGADGNGPTGDGGHPDLVLIMSADAFRDLPTWREPRRILELARVAVLPRGGLPKPQLDWLGADLADVADRVTILDAPRLELSGHEIRARVAAGRSIHLLVPSAVETYIDDHSLYRDSGRHTLASPERIPPP